MTDGMGDADRRSELERLRARVSALEEGLAWESEVNKALMELAGNLLTAASIDDISYEVLEQAKRLTGSRFGFVGYIDPQTGYIISPTMTRDIWDACEVKDKSIVFEKFTGLWGWVLLNRAPLMTNDPANDPRSSGVPEGHIPIRRFLSSPALSGGELMGQIALANAERDYTERDMGVVQILADIYAIAIRHERSDEALRRSEEKYRLIYDYTGESIYTYDTSFNIIGVNKTAAEFIGYSTEELLGCNILELDILHPDDYERTMKDIQRLFQGEVVTDELRFIRRDGTVATGEVTGAPLYDRDGEIIAFTNVGRDITERKEAEKAQQDQLNFIQGLIETIPSPIYYKDPQGRYLGCNRAFEDFAGLQRDEMTGKTVQEIAPSELAETYRRMDIALLTGPGTQIYEGLHRHTDGTLRDVVFNKAVFYDTEGNIAGIVGVILDITERKRSEEVLRRINEELDAYAYVVSHDLRGPISVIASAASALRDIADKECGDKTDQVRQLAELISKSSDGARELVEDLLSLAQVGQAPAEVSQVDVSAVVERVLEERADAIAEKKVEVERDEDLGRIIAYPTHIYQLFSNLIENAVRYNEDPHPKVSIHYVKEKGGWHHYRVVDNGPGIPEEDLERIFAPLFKGKTGGSGIGLATVKKIVEIYEGGIKAYNDGGACFDFTLRDTRAEE